MDNGSFLDTEDLVRQCTAGLAHDEETYGRGTEDDRKHADMPRASYNADGRLPADGHPLRPSSPDIFSDFDRPSMDFEHVRSAACDRLARSRRVHFSPSTKDSPDSSCGATCARPSGKERADVLAEIERVGTLFDRLAVRLQAELLIQQRFF